MASSLKDGDKLVDILLSKGADVTQKSELAFSSTKIAC